MAVLIREEKLLTVITAPTPMAIHTIKNINLRHAPRDSAKANENNFSNENLFLIIYKAGNESLIIFPSSITMIRSAFFATSGSCVTRAIVDFLLR